MFKILFFILSFNLAQASQVDNIFTQENKVKIQNDYNLFKKGHEIEVGGFHESDKFYNIESAYLNHLQHNFLNANSEKDLLDSGLLIRLASKNNFFFHYKPVSIDQMTPEQKKNTSLTLYRNKIFTKIYEKEQSYIDFINKIIKEDKGKIYANEEFWKFLYNNDKNKNAYLKWLGQVAKETNTSIINRYLIPTYLFIQANVKTTNFVEKEKVIAENNESEIADKENKVELQNNTQENKKALKQEKSELVIKINDLKTLPVFDKILVYLDDKKIDNIENLGQVEEIFAIIKTIPLKDKCQFIEYFKKLTIGLLDGKNLDSLKGFSELPKKLQDILSSWHKNYLNNINLINNDEFFATLLKKLIDNIYDDLKIFQFRSLNFYMLNLNYGISGRDDAIVAKNMQDITKYRSLTGGNYAFSELYSKNYMNEMHTRYHELPSKYGEPIFAQGILNVYLSMFFDLQIEILRSLKKQDYKWEQSAVNMMTRDQILTFNTQFEAQRILPKALLKIMLDEKNKKNFGINSDNEGALKLTGMLFPRNWNSKAKPHIKDLKIDEFYTKVFESFWQNEMLVKYGGIYQKMKIMEEKKQLDKDKMQKLDTLNDLLLNWIGEQWYEILQEVSNKKSLDLSPDFLNKIKNKKQPDFLNKEKLQQLPESDLKNQFLSLDLNSLLIYENGNEELAKRMEIYNLVQSGDYKYTNKIKWDK